MKSPSISRFASVAGTALLNALLSVCQLSAATNPLNQPRGLALASNGNLYFANSGKQSSGVQSKLCVGQLEDHHGGCR
jgi:hypothetical protein